MGADSIGGRLDSFVAQRTDAPLPENRELPRSVAPLPVWLENLAFRLLWLVVAINLAGTAFGFWFYRAQLSATPLVMWPIVPVSPLATLYLALSLIAWRRGYTGRVAQLIHVLAVMGCLKYGLWAVFVQLFIEGPSHVPFVLWQFLIWSHVGMVAQAFLVQRYAQFPLWAVVTATGWFVLNDILDFFVSVLGGPHHTWINELWRNGFDRTLPAYDAMAVAAVVTTLISVALVLATHRAVRRMNGRR